MPPFRESAPQEQPPSDELKSAKVAVQMQNLRTSAASENARARDMYGYGGKVPMAAALGGGVVAFAVILGALVFVGMSVIHGASVAALMAILLSGYLLMRR